MRCTETMKTWESRRQRIGLSQTRFSELSTVNQAHLSMILAGNRKNISVDTFDKIEETLREQEAEVLKSLTDAKDAGM